MNEQKKPERDQDTVENRPVPSQAEGDRETVEDDLKEQERREGQKSRQA